MIPQMKMKVDKISRSPNNLNDFLTSASDQLDALKSEISRARDTVSKYVFSNENDLTEYSRRSVSPRNLSLCTSQDQNWYNLIAEDISGITVTSQFIGPRL